MDPIYLQEPIIAVCFIQPYGSRLDTTISLIIFFLSLAYKGTNLFAAGDWVYIFFKQWSKMDASSTVIQVLSLAIERKYIFAGAVNLKEYIFQLITEQIVTKKEWSANTNCLFACW